MSAFVIPSDIFRLLCPDEAHCLRRLVSPVFLNKFFASPARWLNHLPPPPPPPPPQSPRLRPLGHGTGIALLLLSVSCFVLFHALFSSCKMDKRQAASMHHADDAHAATTHPSAPTSRRHSSPRCCRRRRRRLMPLLSPRFGCGCIASHCYKASIMSLHICLGTLGSRTVGRFRASPDPRTQNFRPVARLLSAVRQSAVSYRLLRTWPGRTFRCRRLSLKSCSEST